MKISVYSVKDMHCDQFFNLCSHLQSGQLFAKTLWSACLLSRNKLNFHFFSNPYFIQLSPVTATGSVFNNPVRWDSMFRSKSDAQDPLSAWSGPSASSSEAAPFPTISRALCAGVAGPGHHVVYKSRALLPGRQCAALPGTPGNELLGSTDSGPLSEAWSSNGGRRREGKRLSPKMFSKVIYRGL